MMRRRDFLRATLITAGSVVVPAACSEEDVIDGACNVEPGDLFFPQSIASGDPRPDSVVLWTRLLDPDATADVSVTLTIALDESFTQVVAVEGAPQKLLPVLKAHDYCVKVKVGQLEPETTYYYRFFYLKQNGCYGSRIGRTRTAPKPDTDVKVRFAFLSCQDFVGRYFNAHAVLAKLSKAEKPANIDFFVHLGSYIYETAGDPRLPAPPENRKLTFTDEPGALPLTAAGQPYFAAKSLGNYRELYQKYRSDPALQRVHELLPMVAIWDDHEFSDDCHGATACYSDGKQQEGDVERRKAANQAWFEYMPVDYPDEGFEYDPAADFPGDIRVYRDFQFGKHVHLIMTDLRSYRGDHLIPEEAFPGQVIVTSDRLDPDTNNRLDRSYAYCELDSAPGDRLRDVLVENAQRLGYEPKHMTGSLNAEFINVLVDRINNLDPKPSTPILPLDDAEIGTRDKGYAYVNLGKNELYTSIGSRYLVVKDAFDTVSQILYTDSTGGSAVVMGDEQETWFSDKMAQSSSTWKVWGNEFCLAQLAIDLQEVTGLSPELQRRCYVSCDAWDGFRDRRSKLIEQLWELKIKNVVAITGGANAFFASTPTANSDPTKKVVEFVSSSISTRPYGTLLASQLKSDPALSALKDTTFADDIDALLLSKTSKINPHLAYSNSVDNGFCIAEASAAEFVVSMLQIPEVEFDKSQYALDKSQYVDDQIDALTSKIKISRFKTVAGGSDLYWEDDNAWKRWDPTTLSWVAT